MPDFKGILDFRTLLDEKSQPDDSDLETTSIPSFAIDQQKQKPQQQQLLIEEDVSQLNNGMWNVPLVIFLLVGVAGSFHFLMRSETKMRISNLFSSRKPKTKLLKY